MKKLITILFATFLAVYSFAKTADELVAEYWSTATSFNDYRLAFDTIKSVSEAEAKTAIITWATGEAGMFGAESKRSEEMKKQVQAARLMSGQYLKYVKKDFIKELPLIFACEVVGTEVLKAYEVENPSLYQELKAKDFTIDGVRLRNHAIVNLACCAGDIEYVMSLPIEQVANIATFQSMAIEYLLKLPVDKAMAKVVEIENYYLIKKQQIPKDIEALSRKLTLRQLRN